MQTGKAKAKTYQAPVGYEKKNQIGGYQAVRRRNPRSTRLPRMVSQYHTSV